MQDVESDKSQGDKPDAEEIEEVQGTRASRKPLPRPTINGKAVTKGKGKAKAAEVEIDAMEVDGIETLNYLEDGPIDLDNATNATGRKSKSSTKDPAAEHLEEKLRRVCLFSKFYYKQTW